MRPEVNKGEESAFRQKNYHDRHAKFREFNKGDNVWIKRKTEDPWEPGIVMERTTPLSYQTKLQRGVVKVHADHMRQAATGEMDIERMPVPGEIAEEENNARRNVAPDVQQIPENGAGHISIVQPSPGKETEQTAGGQNSNRSYEPSAKLNTPRRSNRTTKKPIKLDL